MKNEIILMVVAHPDDEILGAGATIDKLSKNGAVVNCIILSGNVEARSTKLSTEKILGNIKKSGDLIGINDHLIGSFKNMEMNTYPHLEIVQFIEDGIRKYKPTTIITHNESDINNDHYITNKACLAASRLYQRQLSKNILRRILTMEIPSSTDWALTPSASYKPNYFSQIHSKNLERKIEALKAYEDVLRPEPHPRSINAIKALAVVRGSQCGSELAESFESVYGLLLD